jgi:acyl-CoA oxidase
VAIAIGGTAIKEISNRNLQMVKENNDFSMMAETHSVLCLGKALFSEIAYDGIEICRKACGGHGFSHYSGLPGILMDYASNLTY